MEIFVFTAITFGQMSDFVNQKSVKNVPIDAAITAFLSPVSDYNLTTLETVTIRIENFGTEAIYDFMVNYSSSLEPPVFETIATSVPPGGFLDHSFPEMANLSVPGYSYTFTATVIVTGDTIYSNNTLSTTITHLTNTAGSNCLNPIFITALPYQATGLSTDLLTNDFDPSDACNSLFMSQKDIVFNYTPNKNKLLKIELNNSSDRIGFFVTDGCPDVSSSQCIFALESESANPVIDSLPVDSAVNYFFTLSSDSDAVITFDIAITEIDPQSLDEYPASVLKIYPNPVSEMLFIETKNMTHNLRVVIYNSTGQKVNTTEFSNVFCLHSINTKLLDDGIYLLCIWSGETFISKTILLNQ